MTNNMDIVTIDCLLQMPDYHQDNIENERQKLKFYFLTLRMRGSKLKL